MKSLVSIITVNYNGLEITLEMISSLFSYIESPFEIIVVDNGSVKNEAEDIRKREPRAIVLRSETNLGFAGGNNLGMLHAKGDYFLLLNNDTIIEKDILPPLLHRFSFSEKIGAVGPKILFAQPPRLIQFAGYTPMSGILLRNNLIGYNKPDCGQYNIARPTPAILGAAMMVSRKAAEKAGYMPETYFLYYEELDWCERLKEAGFELWYEPDATVLHRGSVTAGGKESPLSVYYLTRNRLYYAQRNLKIPARWISYGFQIGIALPKECFKNLLAGKSDLIKVRLSGVKDFILRKDSFRKPEK